MLNFLQTAHITNLKLAFQSRLINQSTAEQLARLYEVKLEP